MVTKTKEKLIIIGGFLGSGKTSFLINLARFLARDKKIAILENEIGKISIDGSFLTASGLSVTNLFAGCVCCSMSGTLPITIRKIEQEIAPDYILIEATGVAFPINIRDNLMETLELPARLITLADAKRFPKMTKAMPDLIRHQLEGADAICLNKTDLLCEDEITEVTGLVKDFNDEADIYPISMLKGESDDLYRALLSENP